MKPPIETLKRIVDASETFLYRKTGKKLEDFTFDNFVRFLYAPTDPASLGISRMLFGFMMVLDGPEERGGAEMDLRWGDPQGCHFPLIPLKVLPLPYMALLYAVMWFGAIGIGLGYNFRRSVLMFTIPYWYILLLDKSFWNNHSYLFGLVGILLAGSQANNYMSLDAYYDKSKSGQSVPYWNYFILKYQFFILYFVAGLKKSDREWLSGYSMTNLSSHWVFSPFRMFLSVDQTDYIFVHWFAFVFDLTVCFWMMYEYTRPIAMLFCALFHLMNSRLFTIGMFPWVCLATMPLFCPPDWPKSTAKSVKSIIDKCKFYFSTHSKRAIEMKDMQDIKNNESDNTHVDDKKLKNIVNDNDDSPDDKINDDDCNDNKNMEISNHEKIEHNKEFDIKICKKKRIVAGTLIFYMAIQAFLPYSHFITKGYNNWTNGLYGYSWDMMVNTWDTILIMVKVVDNESKAEIFLDPEAWTQNDRWSKHGDMMYQYAHCIQRNLVEDLKEKSRNKLLKSTDSGKNRNVNSLGVITSTNISIYVDVWCSMNSRFQQRMFDPNRDLLTVKWSPFENVEWLMPMLTDLNHWRKTMTDIQKHVYTWNNYSDVLFIADFPGMYLENYITPDLSNVTLTVLEGQILYDVIEKKNSIKTETLKKTNAVHMTVGESMQVLPGVFHRVHIVGDTPACYMYTFMNATLKNIEEDHGETEDVIMNQEQKPKLPLFREFSARLSNIGMFLQHIGNAFLYILYGVPMMRRIEIR